MLVTIYNQERMQVIHLADRPEGRYEINNPNIHGNIKKIASIEADEGRWVLCCMPGVMFLDQNEYVQSMVLEYGVVLRIVAIQEQLPVYIFTEQDNVGYTTFTKYRVSDNQTITIGRNANNIISCNLPYISGEHGVLYCVNGAWSIIDSASSNGIYVNQLKVQNKNLQYGDCIYIMGLKIIVGNGFIAVNSPYGLMRINSETFQQFSYAQVNNNNSSYLEEDIQYFAIVPRFWNKIETAKLTVDMPTSLQKAEQQPVALVVGPALTMGMASLSSGALSLYTAITTGSSVLTAIPMLLMSVSMLTGATLWPVINRKSERKKKKEQEEKRQELYLKYLNEIKDQIKRIGILQKELLEKNVINTDECIYRIVNLEQSLWERLPNQEDFLAVCIGKGDSPMQIEIKYPDERFSLEKDTLKDALRILKNEDKMLYQIPIAFSLKDNKRIGMIGEHDNTVNFTLALLTQVVALHNYQEVKLMFLVDEFDKEWSMFRWIPHVWNNKKSERYYYTDIDDVKEFDEFWKQMSVQDDSETYYIIVAVDWRLTDSSNEFKNVLRNENLPVTVITVFDELKYTPREMESLIDIDGIEGKLYSRNNTNTNYILFQRECYTYEANDMIIQQLANCFLKEAESEDKLADVVTFLEMYGIGKVEHLNVLERWKKNNPVRSLKVPIGYNEKSELFYMDLHEKQHGPHGLVAGMTGSGKSEFIITLVLSLAVNFHPDEVAFILIDYKGGGLAGAFEDVEKGKNLPHLAGTITNLDGSSVKRAMVSIQSELRRRQRVFNEARKVADEGTMDIYKYQELYRLGIVSEPMPHLMIISDEFAELKSQQPEFMDQLISAARIGRSLGVHLILATQKPSGVVNEQIWSNSKFKVCLKVQDRADSMEVIKREDAANLVQTGRFYLQVGYNEYFAIGQSAWCGADYVDRESNREVLKEEIEVIDTLGHVTDKLRPYVSKEEKKLRRKELVEIVDYLCKTASIENIGARKLWLPPIPEKIYIDEIIEKYGFIHNSENGLYFAIGEYDDPEHQMQNLMKVSFTESGNGVLFGSAESGKDMFTMTMISQLLQNYTSEQLLLFVMDFGTEVLKVVETAPQVGGVVYSSESERIEWLFRFLLSELDRRKKAFANYGGEYEAYRKAGNKEYSYIVIILNEYIGFREGYEEHESDLMTILRDGVKCGVFVWVTASTTGDVRYRMMQLFRQTIALQLNDKSEYISIFGKVYNMFPSSYRGRGLMKEDTLYEFQTAFCDRGEVIPHLQNLSVSLQEKMPVATTKIPYLCEAVTFENLRYAGRKPYLLPLGYCSNDISLCGLRLDKDFVFPVAAKEIGRLRAFIQELIRVSTQYGMETYVFDAEKIVQAENNYYCDDFENRIIELFNETRDRNNLYAKERNKDVFSGMSEQVYIIAGLEKLFSALSDDGKDKLETVLRLGKAFFKIHIIIAERESGFLDVLHSSWYQTNVYGQNGIWIGTGINRQKMYDVNTYRLVIRDEMPYSYGYLIEGDRIREGRFLHKEGMESE